MAIDALSVNPQEVTSLTYEVVKNDDFSILNQAAKFVAPRVSIAIFISGLLHADVCACHLLA